MSFAIAHFFFISVCDILLMPWFIRRHLSRSCRPSYVTSVLTISMIRNIEMKHHREFECYSNAPLMNLEKMTSWNFRYIFFFFFFPNITDFKGEDRTLLRSAAGGWESVLTPTPENLTVVRPSKTFLQSSSHRHSHMKPHLAVAGRSNHSRGPGLYVCSVLFWLKRSSTIVRIAKSFYISIDRWFQFMDFFFQPSLLLNLPWTREKSNMFFLLGGFFFKWFSCGRICSFIFFVFFFGRS